MKLSFDSPVLRVSERKKIGSIGALAFRLISVCS